MNVQIMAKYFPLFVKAMLLTLKIGWIGIVFATLIGILCAIIRFYKIPVLHQIAGVYIEIFRNTPLLVQLFFLYFAFPKIGIPMNAGFCGALGLALLGGAYMAETFRSGLEAVEKNQRESALALGMNQSQAMTHVIFPQAFSTSVPGFTANVIFLLKETSVFSAISLMDLMFTAKDLIGVCGIFWENNMVDTRFCFNHAIHCKRVSRNIRSAGRVCNACA